MIKPTVNKRIESFLSAAYKDQGFVLNPKSRLSIMKGHSVNGVNSTISIGASIVDRSPMFKIGFAATIGYDNVYATTATHYIYGSNNFLPANYTVGSNKFKELDTQEINNAEELDAYLLSVKDIIDVKVLPYLETLTDIKKFAPFFVDHVLNKEVTSSMGLAQALLLARDAAMPEMDKILLKLYRKSKSSFDHKEFKTFIAKHGFKQPKGLLSWF